MGYPNWLTPAGDLGRISALDYYNFKILAEEANNEPITFAVIAGQLPPGIRLYDSGQIQGHPDVEYINISGVPTAVNQDRSYTFTVRAKANNNPAYITDRTFSLTITGNYPPQILTTTTSLGSFLDGTKIDIQLEAVDLNNDTLTWQVTSGTLPNGLELSTTGRLLGVLLPYGTLPEGLTSGWDDQRWDQYGWEFSTKSSNKNYQFTVSVTDGKAIDSRTYEISVYSHSNTTADNDTITADDTIILTADNDEKRTPVLLTETLGEYTTYKSDNYFSFKFDAIDLDGDAVEYSISVGGLIGFDATGTTFDTTLFDRGTFSLPSGLILKADTGWLIGYIPPQLEPTANYTFAVQVYKKNYPSYISKPKIFTLTVLGSLDLDIKWLSDSDLGVLYAGEISNLSVKAISLSNKSLSYRLDSTVSRLPQGLSLLNDGNISGRCSFQSFTLDSGTTTFDLNVFKNLENFATTFDRTYKFTVIATDNSGVISSQKTFSIKILNQTIEPYENVWLECLPELAAREKFFSIIDNSDIFPNDSLYRVNDPYYGKNRSIYLLAAYGLTASAASDYIAAMQDRHYNKPLYFGNYGFSVAKDDYNNILYEVVWVDIIENTRSYINNVKQPAPQASVNLKNQIYNWNNPNFNANDPAGYTLKVNDSQLMRQDLDSSLGLTNPGALPIWMTSTQNDGTVLGFTTKAVLAYVKPGEGAKVVFRLNRAKKNNIIPDIKEIPFVADRYILENTLSQYFDLDTKQWLEHYYTTFDTLAVVDQNYSPIATVDFASDIPFEYINGRTIVQLESAGGIDGIITSYLNKTLIFATQENYSGYNLDQENQGWIRFNQFYDDYTGFDHEYFDAVDVIPGYVEAGANPNIQNQRAGVWKITLDSNNLIKLVFVSEIPLGKTVRVRYGSRYGGNVLLYDPASIVDIATVPSYTIFNEFGIQIASPTTFDNNTTRFLSNIDVYAKPFDGDHYLKFPKVTVFG